MDTELRHNEQKVSLDNQSIIEFLYAIKELLQIVEGHKLFMEKASCYLHNFYVCRGLIAYIDKDYKDIHRHQQVVEFFEHHEVDNSFDRISIVPRKK